MTSTSKIEWTEQTWNPVTGCTKVSPGCKHCYAETLSKRLRGMGVTGYEGPFTVVRMVRERLNQPLHRKKATVYFVNSMSDLFHPEVTDEYLDAVMDVMRQTPQHAYQVLTKRAERLPQYFADRTAPPNLWLGVSVENRRYGVPRIAYLQQVDAPIRFLSCEPLLADLGKLDLQGIHWVIVGGESGHKARPMKPQWAHAIRRQCEAARIPYFFKQWGACGEDGIRRTKKANGRLLDGVEYNQYPQAPAAKVIHAVGQST